MKKILLLLISGLLVLTLSGTTMAGDINLLTPPDPDTQKYIIPEGGQLNVPFEVTGLTKGSTYTMMFTVTGSGLSGEIQEFSVLPSSSGGVTWTHTFTYDGDDEGNIHIERSSTVPAGQGTVQVNIIRGDSTDVANAAVTGGLAAAWMDIAIPEFPTVALPIAAIIGLVFIFGRKKEGM